jgi:hypothetical protein
MGFSLPDGFGVVVECDDAEANRLPDLLRERTASVRPILV